MIPWRNHALTFVVSILLFIVMLLTLSNSTFICEVTVNGQPSTCAAHKISDTQEKMCQGTVFLISAHTGEKDILILCPWNTATSVLTVIGTVAAFLYAFLAIFQYVKPLSQKVILGTGFLTFPLLVASTVLMLTGISDGGKKCEEFEADLMKDNEQGHCSNAAYGMDFILGMIALLMFGYEVIQVYLQYKYGTTEIDYDYKDYEDFSQAPTEVKEHDLKTFHLPEDD